MNNFVQDDISTGPLRGIRVVDFSSYVAGPYCTMLLGDMGADVIKVEPLSGEQWRHQDPFASNLSRSFMSLNRNKRSIALDLKDPDGLHAALELLATADVMVHNWRPGVAERLGLGYEDLRSRFPRLIYATNSAYGPKGPMAKKGGYDLVIQSISGLLASNPAPDGAVPKRYAGVAIVDFTAGDKLAYGITCALIEQARTGRGQRVDSSLMEAALGLQRQKLITIEQLPSETPVGNTLEKMRAAADQSASAGARELYYRTYQTLDGFITVGCLNVPQREILLSLLDIEDPWRANPDKLPADAAEDQARRALVARVEAIFAMRSTADWFAAIDAHQIPCAPVQMSTDVLRDPQVISSDYLFEFNFSGYGKVRSIGTGVRVESGGGVRLPPPRLGEHSAEILAELGLAPATQPAASLTHS